MSTAKNTAPLWERTVLRKTAGCTLRPGGFKLTDRAVSLASIPEKGRVLDAGCGLGATVAHLINCHGFEAFGVDNSARQLAEAPQHLPLTRADASCLPYPDSFFDAVFCECVLSLMPDLPGTIAEFKRILKPSGQLIISDIYQRIPQTKPSIKGSCASSPLDFNELARELQKNGIHTSNFEDHSKLLAELAARLIFAGEPDIRLTGNCCGKPGYMLLTAEMKP